MLVTDVVVDAFMLRLEFLVLAFMLGIERTMEATMRLLH